MAVTLNAEAARIGGAPRSAIHVPGPGHMHPGHVHGGVAIGVGIGLGFGYWPGYYYPPAYYAAPPVYYAPPPPPPPAVPTAAYWYYCPQAGAYYPYTPSCPGPWQLVAPTPSTY